MFHDPLCLKPLYCCFIRPIIEYASVAWSPAQIARIVRIEKNQKRFTRIAIKRLPWRNTDSIPPYKTRCHLLVLETLENRTLVAQCMFVFKVLTGHIDTPHSAPLAHQRRV